MTLPARRFPPGFRWLIAAQFASALADNALLIVTIALLQEQGWPGWWAPLLKFGFTLSYVLLAPFVGPLADSFAKARLMACMNAVKALGVLALLNGTQPALAFAVVGFGAAAYAPCKYGLITELVPMARLVAANGWLEVSVVCATLQFAVLRWAVDELKLTLDQAAYLQAAVAVGVVAGAAIAGRLVPLSKARRMLPAGVVLGLMMPAVASAGHLGLAVPLLTVVGIVGGLMVVPLNALLQHRGHQLLSAGRSIAVQGCSENASILAMLAGYAALIALDVAIVPLMWVFGAAIAASMVALMARRADPPRSAPQNE